MPWWHALLFGIVEGVTEFLPISSTGHLTVTEKLLGYQIDHPDITAFTAIIQVGAVLATILYLRKDIVRIVGAWFRGLTKPTERGADYRFGWAVIYGCIPIAIVGLLFQDQIETTLRSLWIVGGTLIAFSGVMWLADRQATQQRHEKDITWKDTLIIGVVQCLSLIPGISRSGATMSAGLFRGLDRVAVTKLSFFLSIPVLAAAGVLQTVQQYDAISAGVGWGPTLLATAVSFVVAYASVAWLLKFIARNTYSIFIIYRVVVGVVILLLVGFGVVSAT
ncbi:undecaprenyl-diphosphate phosphatase [Nakamurella lactea]|uniref:undecaprenyl-diphosphate phosphatase n=1 Tax=Nakamurella lactea TaxID=459515 RepID=UPI00041B1A05|nr:undecaprenyl-diphosphate phosphatase [Nakamurella lactea]